MSRLVIREFRASDRPDLLTFVRDPDQLRFMLFDLSTEEAVDRFLDRALAQAASASRTEWSWALEEVGAPGVVGSVDLMRGEPGDPEAELGYWLQRRVWGRGYAVEASRHALAFGFGALGLHRIWGKCHVENAASARVMEKLGMVREGTVREHAWLRDHWRSSHLYGILEEEYRRADP